MRLIIPLALLVVLALAVTLGEGLRGRHEGWHLPWPVARQAAPADAPRPPPRPRALAGAGAGNGAPTLAQAGLTPPGRPRPAPDIAAPDPLAAADAAEAAAEGAIRAANARSAAAPMNRTAPLREVMP